MTATPEEIWKSLDSGQRREFLRVLEDYPPLCIEYDPRKHGIAHLFRRVSHFCDMWHLNGAGQDLADYVREAVRP